MTAKSYLYSISTHLTQHARHGSVSYSRRRVSNNNRRFGTVIHPFNKYHYHQQPKIVDHRFMCVIGNNYQVARRRMPPDLRLSRQPCMPDLQLPNGRLPRRIDDHDAANGGADGGLEL